MIYLLVFLISCLLIYIGERCKKGGQILIIVALILPCVFAGVRGVSVGTDTGWYPKRLFDVAISSKSFSYYYNTIIYQNIAMGLLYRVSSFEFGFSMLTFIITRIFNNFQILLFIIQLIIILPLYFGLKKYKYIVDNKKIWLSMLLYYFFLFNWSFNAIRQFMAISIIFWGLSCVINNEKKMWKKYILSLLIALSFHKTSVISFAILLIFYVFKHENIFKIVITKNKKIAFSTILILFFATACCILLFIPNIFKNIVLFFNVDQKYINYIGTRFSIIGSSIFVVPVLLIFIVYRNRFKLIHYYNFYIIMYMLYIFSMQLSTVNSQFGARISFYFLPFSIVGMPLLIDSPKIVDNRSINRIIVILTALSYWIYNFAIKNYGQTFPYVLFD